MNKQWCTLYPEVRISYNYFGWIVKFHNDSPNLKDQLSPLKQNINRMFFKSCRQKMYLNKLNDILALKICDILYCCFSNSYVRIQNTLCTDKTVITDTNSSKLECTRILSILYRIEYNFFTYKCIFTNVNQMR